MYLIFFKFTKNRKINYNNKNKSDKYKMKNSKSTSLFYYLTAIVIFLKD